MTDSVLPVIDKLRSTQVEPVLLGGAEKMLMCDAHA